MTIRDLTTAVARDLRRSFAAVAAFEVLFKLLTLLVVAPGLAAVLFHLIRAGGRTAVTNTDILGFLLSPAGVLYGFVLGLKLLGLGLLEHAGVLALAALKQTGHWHGLRHALLALAGRSVRVLRLAALLLAIAAAVVAPLAGLAALSCGWLLGDQDVNYYLAVRPPRFYIACAAGAVLFATVLALLAVLYVRWVFSLPIVLLEDRQPIPALRASALRGAGARWRIGAVLLSWLVFAVVLQAGAILLLALVAGGVLSATGERPRLAAAEVAVLLVVKGVVLAGLSFFTVVVHCLLILRLYVEASVRQGVLDPAHWADALDVAPTEKSARRLGRLEWGALAVVVAAGVAYLALTLPFTLVDSVEGTAHRGYSKAAPENTLAAVRKASDAGADWAEIDVQLTRDGEVILLHDNDLMRLTGERRRPGQLTLAEVRKLKLRPPYSNGFPDERIATLREVIDLARQRGIKLNIELKFIDKKDLTPLARTVARLLRDEEFEDSCFVASLDYDGVIEARRHNPDLKTAAIVTVALGDISKLDVDVLSVNAKLATEGFIRLAHRAGKKVHVWTVNDRKSMRRFIERGADNIITDDPELFSAVKAERDELGDVQRLLLACRHLLD
jgi:glycerophosphoryl diester phosphodiesterase